MSEYDSIIEVDEEEEFYTIVYNNLIRNKEMSPECRMLIIYLTSNTAKFQIRVSQLANHFKGFWGREKLRKIMKEAVFHGYMNCEKINIPGGKKGTSGSLNRLKYIVSKKPKFKKCFPETGFTSPEIRSPENQAIKEVSSSSLKEEERNNNINNKAPKSLSMVAEAPILCTFFLEEIKKRNPKFKDPKLDKWTQEMNRLICLDNRTPEDIHKVIVWASSDKWYKVNCLSPENLRKNFDQMFMKMESEKEEFLIQENRKYALDLKANYPEQMKNMSFDKNFIFNGKGSKEVSLNMNHESFKKILINIFGGRYE
jgi:hypothetical protein